VRRGSLRSRPVVRTLALLPWLALLAFPLLELSAHALTRARVPSLADYRAAAAFVRKEMGPRDAVAAAPSWSDPIVRHVLGDRIDLAMAGRSDLARYERLWALSIRGAHPAEAAAREPSLRRAFGRVEVLRWDLGPSRLRYDFVEQLPSAEVRFAGPRSEGECALRNGARARGGGLGTGVLPPARRFDCEPGLSGTWVGQVVMEDLDLEPRHCVYQPPAGPNRLTVTYRDVPLGDELQLYAGLYYEHERMRKGGPIKLTVRIDGREAGEIVHRDGDGWKPLTLRTEPGSAELTVEVTAPEPRRRHFCWAGSTRAAEAGR
jgi:hypothetical protein